MPAAKTTEVPELDASAEVTDLVLPQGRKRNIEFLAENNPERYNAILEDIKAGEAHREICKRHKCSGEDVCAILTREGLHTFKDHVSKRLATFIARGSERLADEVDKIPLSQLPVAVAVAMDKKAMYDGDQQPHIVEHRVLRVSLKGKLSGLRDGSKS